VPVTLAPRCRNLELDQRFESPTVTRDSVTVAKEIELPLLLFLTLPNLQVTQIEEEFSAEITGVEESERATSGRLASPLRLNVTPASRTTTFDRQTRSTFDLDIRMVAEIEEQSVGMEMLSRAANNAIFERTDEATTKRLRTNPTVRPEGFRPTDRPSDTANEP
jgi:hypothetical protein